MTPENSFLATDLIFILAATLSLASFYVAKFKVKFSEAIPMVPLSITVFLFLFGALKILKLGGHLLDLSIVSLFIYSLFLIKKDTKRFVENFFSPGLLLYLSWCCLVYLLYNDISFTHHDDFNHWGLTSKISFMTNAIAAGPEFSTSYQDYPPAVSLFQYWATKTKDSYCEAIALFSMSLWGYSLIAYPAKNLKWSSPFSIILFAIFGFLILFTFLISPVETIIYYQYGMVDYLLAISFGYSLLLATRIRENSAPINIFNLAIALCCLALIKKIGFFLSFVALFVALYNIFRDNKLVSIKNLNLKNSKQIIKTALPLSIPLIATISLWKIFLSYNSVKESYVNKGFTETISDMFEFNIDFPQRTSDIISIYSEAIYNMNILNSASINISFLFFVLLIQISFFSFYKNCDYNSDLKKRIIGNYKIINVAFLLFMIGHISMYIFVLSEGESHGLSSFLRYLLPFSAGMLFFLMSTLIDLKSKNKFITYLAMILLIVAINPIHIIKNTQNRPTDEEKQIAAEAIRKKQKKKLINILQEDIKSDNQKLRKWAKNKLREANRGSYNININISAAQIIRSISKSQDKDKVKENIVLLTKVIKSQDYKNPNMEICIFEGVPGSGYGYSLMLRYDFAPLKIGKRFIAWKIEKEEQRNWHRQHFYNEMNSCSHIFVIEANNVLRNNYSHYFKSPIINNRLYKKHKTPGDKFYFTLLK